MPRPKRPSETYRPPEGLTPDQAEAMKALSGDGLYATVGGNCLVVRVGPQREIGRGTLKELERLGLVEVVMLPVYEKRTDV